jgi:hypothetical protein
MYILYVHIVYVNNATGCTPTKIKKKYEQYFKVDSDPMIGIQWVDNTTTSAEVLLLLTGLGESIYLEMTLTDHDQIYEEIKSRSKSINAS